eukprot:COSAG01_NODE_892_length_12895_cov_10.276446_15_plen_120_part_00
MRIYGSIDIILAGWPCGNSCGNAAYTLGENGRHGLAGPQTGLFKPLVQILKRIRDGYNRRGHNNELGMDLPVDNTDNEEEEYRPPLVPSHDVPEQTPLPEIPDKWPPSLAYGKAGGKCV